MGVNTNYFIHRKGKGDKKKMKRMTREEFKTTMMACTNNLGNRLRITEGIESFVEEICKDYDIDTVKYTQELQALQLYLGARITMSLMTAVPELETRVSKMVHIDDEEEFVCESNKEFANFLNKMKKVEFIDDSHDSIIVEKDEMEALCGSSSNFYKMINEYVNRMISIYDRETTEICLFNDKETWEKYQDENPKVLMIEKRAESLHEITDELGKIIGSMGKYGLTAPSFIVLEGYDHIINSEKGYLFVDLIVKNLELTVICIRNSGSYKVKYKEMFDINSMNDLKIGDAITFEKKGENN